MRTIDIYTDPQGKPQHLAVRQEQPPQAPVMPMFKPLCGANTTGLVLKEQVSPADVHVGCSSCGEQLKMWRDVQAET